MVVLHKSLTKESVAFYNIDLDYHDFELSYRDAIALCKLGTRLNADLWNVMVPRTENEIEKFYEIIRYHLFEAVYVHEI